MRSVLGREQVVPYERRLDADKGWAMDEGGRFFRQAGGVQEALQRITERLDRLGIPYAVVGALALYQHGFRRFTEDVDLLVTRDDLRRIHEAVRGRGFLPVHAQSKNLRETETGVRIEFLLSGDYPGDGRPKPVAFPDPRTSSVQIAGVSYLNLEKLVELKLASGMSAPHRGKDLTDVGELITVLALPLAFREGLDDSVRDAYTEQWRLVRKRYVLRWSPEPTATAAATAALLAEMAADGVDIEPSGGADGEVLLSTTDPELAAKYDMIDESEMWRPDAGLRQ